MRTGKTGSERRTDRLVFSLRQRILDGDFAPGERLTELGLVPLLGASRTPVRLALERLANEGLVAPAASGGFVVKAFTVPEILDAIEIRGVLEGTAVRFAAERLHSPAELSTLKLLLDDASLDGPRTVEAFGRFLAANDRFHREFWRLSRSPRLVQMLETNSRVPFTAAGGLLFVEAERHPEDAYIAAEQHRGIVEAIESREGTRGEALAREHAQVTRRTFVLALERRETLTHVPGARLIVS